MRPLLGSLLSFFELPTYTSLCIEQSTTKQSHIQLFSSPQVNLLSANHLQTQHQPLQRHSRFPISIQAQILPSAISDSHPLVPGVIYLCTWPLWVSLPEDQFSKSLSTQAASSPPRPQLAPGQLQPGVPCGCRSRPLMIFWNRCRNYHCHHHLFCYLGVIERLS